MKKVINEKIEIGQELKIVEVYPICFKILTGFAIALTFVSALIWLTM